MLHSPYFEVKLPNMMTFIKISFNCRTNLLRLLKSNLCICNGVSCFDGVNFKNYGLKQGMVLGGIPAAGVSSIQEDSSGNIWFAGMGGVEYFDGSTFFHFCSKNGLKSDFISVIFVDKKGCRQNKKWKITPNFSKYQKCS